MSHTAYAEFLGSSYESPESSRNDESYGPLFNAETYRGPRNEHFGLEQVEDGYNFAIHVSGDAKNVDFCYTDPTDPDTKIRWSLNEAEQTQEGTKKVFSGFIPGLQPGDLYTVRVDRDNPYSYKQDLLDPYARAITRLGKPDSPDSPAYGVIVGEESDVPLVEKPVINPADLVIYETHIANSTALNKAIPEALRGTYLGFAHESHIHYLQQLGITAVEIEPPMQFFSEPMLVERGKVNDWGYNTAGFFAPHEGYATEPGQQVREWKMMVNALHEAGIAVIADVVYNHTADGPLQYRNNNGEMVNSPTYSLRGLDDEGYYTNKITGEDGRQYYFDTTGCGNTVDTTKPAAAQLVRDSLRYWYNDLGIDGVRFDLAPSVGDSAFFEKLQNDPELKGCFMVAEPWSWGAGYPKGQYAKIDLPEWNGDFRDTARDFWRGGATLGQLAYVMAGSFNSKGVVNFVDAHDGYTMRDLVTFNDKHNELNGEGNRDGGNDNMSWNHGHEGPTDDPRINEMRRKTMHNLIHTLFMSRGKVMWLGGDEINRTQNGNNNAYCRDTDATGAANMYARQWELSPEDSALFDTVASVIAIRKASMLGDPQSSIHKVAESPIDERGIDWLNLWGERMTDQDWNGRVMGVYNSGSAGTADGESYLTYVNGSNEDVQVTLPNVPGAAGDYVLVSDAETGKANPESVTIVPTTFALKAMSSVILKRVSSRLPNTSTPEYKLATDLRIPSLGKNVITLFDHAPMEAARYYHSPYPQAA